MDRLVAFLLNEWNTLKEAPLSFSLLLVFGIIAGFLLATGVFKAAIDVRDQRIAGKEDLLAEYRVRLHLVPSTNRTSYSLFTNKELREKAFALAKSMREFRENLFVRETRKIPLQTTTTETVESEKDQQKRWEENTRKLAEVYWASEKEYVQRFHTDAILLRDELLTRLPAFADPKAAHWYESPSPHWSSLYVSDDLERLAKILPESSKTTANP